MGRLRLDQPIKDVTNEYVFDTKFYRPSAGDKIGPVPVYDGQQWTMLVPPSSKDVNIYLDTATNELLTDDIEAAPLRKD